MAVSAEVLTSRSRIEPRPGRDSASQEHQVTPGNGDEAAAGGSGGRRLAGPAAAPLGPGPPQLQCPPQTARGAVAAAVRRGRRSLKEGREGEAEAPEPSRAGRAGRRSRAGWRAAGRRHGGADRGRDEAPDSGHRQDPQGQGGDRDLRSSLGQGGRTAGAGGRRAGAVRGGVSAEMETSGPAWLRYGPLAGAEPTGIPAARGQTRRVGGALPGLVRRAWSGLGPVLAALPGLGAWWGSVGKGHLAGGHPKRSRLEGRVRHGGGSRRRGTVRPERVCG